MNLSQIVPYILLFLVMASVAGSVTYIGLTAGNPDTRNELQKHVAILGITNLLTCILLGFLLYNYLLSNPASFFPFAIFLMTFNIFLSVMAVSISVLQQV